MGQHIHKIILPLVCITQLCIWELLQSHLQESKLSEKNKRKTNIHDKKTQISVIIVYSHMLHFAFKCPSHTFWSNSKFESAPTVMYCILSSFIQENHKSLQLQFTPITHWLFGCGHLESRYCKIKKQTKKETR